jgi:hypothetical protein
MTNLRAFSALGVTILLTVLAINCLAPSAGFSRGGSGTGGGVVYVCHKDGKQTVRLVDSYQQLKNDGVVSKDIWPDAVLSAAAARLDKENPDIFYEHPFVTGKRVSLGWMLIYRWKGLAATQVATEKPLPLLPDANILPGEIPKDCQVEQLAIQDIDIGRLRMRSDLVYELSHLERGLFWVHEALISLRDKPGASTAPIREKIVEIISAFDFTSLANSFVVPRPDVYRGSIEEQQAGQVLNSGPCREYLRYKADMGKEWLAQRFAKKTLSNCEHAIQLANTGAAKQAALENFPFLLRVPKTLECLAVGDDQRDPTWKLNSLTLIRTEGSGESQDYAHNKYRFDLNVNGKTSSVVADHAWFETGGRGTINEVSHLASFMIQAANETTTRSISNGKSHTLATILDLRDFDERTGLFYGSLARRLRLVSVDTDLNSPPIKEARFGIACWSVDVEFSAPK